jgi:glycosyltransferase involved in cell wall biosynthesis
MIKVLHLTSSFSLSGGAEANLLRLVSHMDRDRFCNMIVTMTEGVNYDLLRERLPAESGVAVNSLKMRRGVPNPLAAVRLSQIVNRFQPQIMQTWMYHADLLGLLAGKWKGVPSIAWNIQCSSLDPAGFGWMSRLVRRLLISLSSFPDVVLTNCQSGLEFHRALGYRPRRWLYMPNSLDFDSFRPDDQAGAWLRSLLSLPSRAPLIGLIGRLHPVKDHETFIKAACILASENPDLHFVLVGKGVEERNGYINGLVTATAVADRFHLLGHRSDVNHITAGLDIACCSSLSEGSPNVVAEAMACGVACVATDVGDSSLILQELGRVVPPRDPEAFAQACRETLAIPPSRRRELGVAARARAKESFSLSKVVARYESLYEMLARADGLAADPSLDKGRLKASRVDESQ